MVYRGRPSTGCKKCRERKIKCDERVGGCIKCAERGLECPGYDRTIDAFFLDETAHVLSKAKKSKAKAIAARDARHEREKIDLREVYLQVMAKDSPGLALTPSLIDQGISYFMSYYTVGVDQPSIQSPQYLDHLSTYGFHPLVATSMTALGIAGIANLHMDSKLRSEATRWYLNAIKMTNAAISSPKTVKEDSTLTSINLLSMFEATSNENSLQGWSNHVDGASMLIKLRGPNQFSTPAGQRMYMHTIGLLVLNCLGRDEPIPDWVHPLNNEVRKHLENTDPRNRFFFLHIRAIDLRARILSRKLHALPEIIEAALALDEVAADIFNNQGPQWDYEVVLCDKKPEIFDNFYHVYNMSIAAQVWNWVRYNRIYFHDIIRNAILAGFSSTPPALVGARYHEQLETSVRILYKMQSDILACVPQFLHDVPNVPPSEASSPTDDEQIHTPPPEGSSPFSGASSTKSSENQHVFKSLHDNFKNMSPNFANALAGTGSVKDRLPIIRIAGGYSTVWALFVAGSMPIASPASQDFVAKSLKRIQAEFGINQAKVLGEALRYKRYLAAKGLIRSTICPKYLPPDEEPFTAPLPTETRPRKQDV